jgi:glutamate N-acetyltransferase/amino-acid N-acetyltransferase
VILLANGASGIERTHATDAEFGQTLREVCADLSRQVVLDGEGATVLLEIEVTGAATSGEANAIAQRIATSSLVKTAAFGRDPNWGRILAAAGSAFCAGGFAQVEVDLLTLRIDGVEVFAHGEPTGADVPLEGAVCRVELELGLGTASAGYLASDLTYDYVRINAEYTT